MNAPSKSAEESALRRTAPAARASESDAEPAARAGQSEEFSRVAGGRFRDALDRAVSRARDGLIALQKARGEFCFELEADCTIPAEYILMMHFTDELDAALETKIAVFLRSKQAEHGGWPLFHGGELDLSCTVKCYWALKMAGDPVDAPHMARARAAILDRGGAARCNVFTRIALALFGEIPWRGTPYVPVEIVLLPKWFPFHLSKVSYWSRTVMVPLSILCSRKVRAKNPRGVHVRELFAVDPERERKWFPVRSRTNALLLAIERTARLCEPLIPGFVRRSATRKAEAWFVERLNGVDGLGGIFPAMVNAYEALSELGYPHDHPLRVQCRAAIRGLVVEHETWAYCQPCVSPIWDTGLAALALQEVRRTEPHDAIDASLERALDWLVTKQVLDGPADWRDYRPDLAPGGWAFQYNNAHYPDLDDTSVVAWALHQEARTIAPEARTIETRDRERARRYDQSVARAAIWLAGMQSKNGGYASFDADNTHYFLNHIPFADHGALLDPPTADVSARCVTLFALLARPHDREALARCLDYLWREQEPFGAWFGRWGSNYVYGTWSVLAALEHVDDASKREPVRRAVQWLKSVQRDDGSFGEDNDTYWHRDRAGLGREGTSFQTAWAVLALLAAGEGDSREVRRGIDWLLAKQLDAQEGGLWYEPWFTAPGFPRVFFLRYHGYCRFFPLWALARYRRALEEART
jgi:squalene-hopene/tetraprenyl-beta-curcumene cyclase